MCIDNSQVSCIVVERIVERSTVEQKYIIERGAIMEKTKEQLVQLFFRIRSFSITATARLETYAAGCNTAGMDINLSEFFLMQKVASLDPDNRFCLQDIQESLSISKSGISKMLATLEKKGHLIRETDRNNRRNLIVSLTEKGRLAVERLEDPVDTRMSEYIALIGEDDLKLLFSIIDRMEEVNNQMIESNNCFLDGDTPEDD